MPKLNYEITYFNKNMFQFLFSLTNAKFEFMNEINVKKDAKDV
jgi:hypothetical protein